METGNGNWKWKMETEMGTKDTPITGAIFSSQCAYTTAAKCLKVVVLLFKNYLNRDRVVGKVSELEHFFIDCVTFNI